MNDETTDSHYNPPVIEETLRPSHSFGGRSLDRYIFDFEVPEGGTGGLEGSEVAPAAPAVAEPAAAEPAIAEPPAALSREEIIAAATEAAAAGSGEAFRTMMAEAQAQQAAARAATPTELPEWDPYDPEVVLAHTMAQFTPLLQRLEQLVAPALQTTAEYRDQQGEQEARTFLDGLKTGDNAIGEFDSDRAIARARLEILQAGDQQIDAGAALERAARAERAYIEQIEAAHAARLGVVAQAHLAAGGEPAAGAGAAGEVATLPRGNGAYAEQLRRSMASRGMRPGVGVPTG